MVFAWLKPALPPLEVAVDSGTGPVVVLLHGIASTAVTFDFLVPLLTPNHRVIALNLYGHGNSPAPDLEYTVDDHVDSVRRTLRRLGIRRGFVLVGHSMGALIAARYAAQDSTAVTRLVMLSLAIYPPASALANPADKAQMGFYQQFYDYLKANPAFTALTAQAINALSPIPNIVTVSETGWEATRRSMTNVIQNQTTIADLALVDVPVDVVYGALDPFLVKRGLTAIEKLANVTTHRIEIADHVVRHDVARLIASIIDEATAGA